MGNSLGKNKRLKNKALIGLLFKEGKGITSYPLKLIYLKTEFSDKEPFKMAVSVGKRNIKKAVDRNRVKRLIREAYRLNCRDNFNNISGNYALMILYLGKSGTTFEHIDMHMKQILSRFYSKIP